MPTLPEAAPITLSSQEKTKRVRQTRSGEGQEVWAAAWAPWALPGPSHIRAKDGRLGATCAGAKRITTSPTGRHRAPERLPNTLALEGKGDS